MKKLFLFLTALSLVSSLFAAQSDEEYRKVIYDRSAKIVSQLEVADTALQHFMLETIAQQYIALGRVNDEFAERSKDLKGEELEALKTWQQCQLSKLHYAFVAQLYANLTAQQVETVKDGMTMGVLPKTYQAHLDMVPSLTEEEKAYILAALTEAREYAMDCSDSKAKHAWFGKYKGRINNYLASRGYDLKKEREDWNARIAAAKQQ